MIRILYITEIWFCFFHSWEEHECYIFGALAQTKMFSVTVTHGWYHGLIWNSVFPIFSSQISIDTILFSTGISYLKEHPTLCSPRLCQWWRTCLPMQETQETWVQPLGWEDPLEEEMATHSRILAWRIPWTEEPGGLQPMGSQKSRTQLGDWTRNTKYFIHSSWNTRDPSLLCLEVSSVVFLITVLVDCFVSFYRTSFYQHGGSFLSLLCLLLHLSF